MGAVAAGLASTTTSAGATATTHSGTGGPHQDGRRCTVWGGPGNDSLVGAHAGDVVCGLGGADHLTAAARGVTLIGGPGNDTLVVKKGTGNGDLLRGDGGNDTLIAGAGSEILMGGPGIDHLKAGAGRDALLGGLSADTLIAGIGRSVLVGEGGNDHLVGSRNGNDVMVGGVGRDDINGNDGQGDEIDGGGDGDTIQQCGTDTEVSDDQGNDESVAAHDSSDDPGDQGENEDGDCQGANTPGISLGEFGGTITNVTANSIDVQLCEVDEVAQAWLTTNNVPGTLCSTMTVTIAFDNTTQIEREGGLPLQVGDDVQAVADTTTSTLNAVEISAESDSD
jgi:hypothetical protein